jgi:heme-degrading monooxygenase HmoA
LKATGVKDYLSTAGNCGVYVLKRIDRGLSEFVLVSFWESFESIRKFEGSDIDRAVYYERDKDFLLNLEPKVAHYEVMVNRTA